jgi:hypothetical protein
MDEGICPSERDEKRAPMGRTAPRGSCVADALRPRRPEQKQDQRGCRQRYHHHRVHSHPPCSFFLPHCHLCNVAWLAQQPWPGTRTTDRRRRPSLPEATQALGGLFVSPGSSSTMIRRERRRLVARFDLSGSLPGLRRVRGHEFAHLRGHRLLVGRVLLSKQATERAFSHAWFIGRTRPRLNRRHPHAGP